MAITTTTSSVSRFLFGQPVVTDSAVTARHVTALVARIAVSAIFLVSGFSKLSDPAGSTAYMNSAGVPGAETLVYVAGMAELLGGLSLLFGFLTRIGALGLFAFLIVTSLFFHDFWNLTGAERLTQMVQFMKNLSIMGGLLMIVASGAGRYSLDAIVRGGGPIAHDYRDPAALTRGVPVRHAGPVHHGI
ncbi:MAG: DoxX family protein [Deltaproteobacteria bacterium]|nr:DoxX family protein [Kofleriaceae bacterium]